MKLYWVEGVFRPKSKSKSLEPFARAIHAENPEQALAQAEEMINGGAWVDGPKVLQRTEEQRMRSMGAPELPGLRVEKAVRPAGKKPAVPKPAPKKPSPVRPSSSKTGKPKPAGKHG